MLKVLPDSPGEGSRRRRTCLISLLICLLPFLVFYWLLPYVGHLTIGNDYPIYSTQQQMELQYSVVHGSFPLYVHGFAGGRASAALTLGGMYHPLSFLAAHSPGYWEGYALQWNTLWRLAFLGLTQLALFHLLLKLGLKTDIAFILSFVTVYNQRMLDMFRYGASLENYTGFLSLSAAMTYLYLAPETLGPQLSVVGATYLLVCGGHPQIAYLGLLGSGLICLMVPAVVPTLRPDVNASWSLSLRYYGRTFAYVTFGVLLASAYLVPLYVEFFRDAPSRVGQPFEASLIYVDRIGGALSNFFNPLRSDVHSAFGSSPLMMVAILTPLVLAPMHQVKARSILLVMWLAALVIFLCGIGDPSAVYRLFWTIVPFASSMRVVGRIMMLLPMILMLMLAWFFRAADDESFRRQMLPIAPWRLALLALVAFIGGYVLLSHSNTAYYTPFKIKPYPSWVNSLIFMSGTASLLLVTIRVSNWRARYVSGILLSALIVVQTVVQLRWGTWTDVRGPTPTLKQMDYQKSIDLAFHGDAGFGMESRELSDMFLQPADIKAIRHGRFWPSPPAAIFRTAGSNTATADRTLASAQNSARVPVTTLYSSFNRLVLSLDTTSPGVLTLTLPYSPQWRVSEGSRRYRAFEWERNQLAIFLPSGSHELEFRFHSPATVAGMLISILTALFLTILFARRIDSDRLRIAVIVTSVIVLTGGFALWDHSLYTGDDLGMRFASPRFPVKPWTPPLTERTN